MIRVDILAGPRVQFMLLALVLLPSLGLALNYDALNPHSIGEDALLYKPATSFNLQVDTLLIDAEVKTFPIDSITFDRAASTLTRFWGSVPVSPKMGVRYSLMTRGVLRKQEGQLEPRKIAEEQWTEGMAGTELIYYTQTRLEIFIGVNYLAIPGFERTSKSATVETRWKFGAATVMAPHIGVVKRAGFVNGGFFFRQGAESSRDVVKSSAQDLATLSFKESVHVPTTVAMFAKIPVAKGFVLAEFAAVQGSEGGNKTDDGDTVTEDYTRAKGVLLMPFGIAGIKATLIHRTLSYADNRTVSVDTIPMSALHLKGYLGNQQNNGFAGIVYGYGKDGQSLTEFNASYKVQAYGLTAGFSLAF